MSVINRIAKFAQAQRVLEYQIGGNVFWGDIAASRTPDYYGGKIAEALSANGWGVRDWSATYTLLNLSPRLYIYVTVQINAPLNENPERVRQGVHAAATNFLDNVESKLVTDSLFNQDTTSGAITVNPTATPGAGYETPSVWQQVFGKDTSAIDAGGKVLGLSVSTLVIAGIVYLAITNTKRR